MGVRFPDPYPPRDLPQNSIWFRSVLGQIEAAELVARTHAPDSSRVEPPREGGDVDILISGPPKYRLQIKEWIPTNVRTPLGTTSIAALARSTRLDVLTRFDGGRLVAPALHRIRIHPDRRRGVAYLARSHKVDSTGNAQMTVLEIASDLMNASVRSKLDGSIRDAHRQLRDYSDAILVPVINLARYPHDQAHLYRHTRDLFSRNTNWRMLGGILFITADHPWEEPVTGFYSHELRFIGLENPNAPASKRLDPYAFNPRLDNEEVYQESTVILSTVPQGTPLRILRRQLWLDGSYFGELPHFVGQPLAVQMPSKALGRSALSGYALAARS